MEYVVCYSITSGKEGNMFRFILLPLLLICIAVIFSACCRAKREKQPSMPSNAVLIDVRSVEEFNAGANAFDSTKALKQVGGGLTIDDLPYGKRGGN